MSSRHGYCLWLVSTWITLAIAASRPSTALSCQDLDISVDLSAYNKDLPSILNLTSLNDTATLNDLVDDVTSSLVTGNYTIRARYCEPLVEVGSRSKNLQVLVHGVTYTLDYWSGLAAPGTRAGQDEYSWILYAAQLGYPTLSVDRLCNGNSSRPEGLIFCQIPLEVAAVHAVIEAARHGTLPGLVRSFSKIIFVGHSYGSVVGNGLTIQFPKDADALILSGFTQFLLRGVLVPTTPPLLGPAALVSPDRFGNLLLDPTYVQFATLETVRAAFYYGNYDQAELEFDFNNRGTATVGEVATLQLGQMSAPGYTGPLFVLNGLEDAVFCSTSPGSVANCTDYSPGVHDIYPNVETFGFHNTANTGHCLNLHRTAQQSYAAAHDFLDQIGY